MAKNKTFNDFGSFVFSTNPDFKPEPERKPQAGIPPEKQVLRIWLERGKGGKENTLIKGWAGPDEPLAELARMLKNKCASGGNAKDGMIILQGDHREKVLKILLDLGYKQTKKAGG